MITNTKVFGNSLDRDINDIFFDTYAVEPIGYDKIAKVSTAPAGDHYTESELSALGELSELPEGTGITFDNPVEGHKKVIYYTAFGKGFQITKRMYRDDLTGNFKKMPQKLAKSAAMKPEAVFFDMFNNGFTSETAWDGQYIFDDHTTLKSVQTLSNYASTPASLSYTTLQAAFDYYMQSVVDEAGFPLVFTPYMLLIHPDNYWMAEQLRNQGMLIGTANNDLNLLNPDNNAVGGWVSYASRWLTSSDAWFLISKEHDHRMLWKEQATLESADDFYTGNALFKTTLEFAVATFDYKGSYGNAGV